MSGMSRRFTLDQSGTVIAEHFQDAQNIYDRNRAGQSDPVRGEFGRPIAEIPLTVALQWYNEEVAKDPTFKMFGPRWQALLKRKLQDRDWLFLNSQPGNSVNFVGWRK